MRYLYEEAYLEEDSELDELEQYFQDDGYLYPHEEVELTEWKNEHRLWHAVLKLSLEDYKFIVDRMLDTTLSSNARIAARKKWKKLVNFFQLHDCRFEFMCHVLHYNSDLIRNRTLIYRQEDIKNVNI